MTARLVVISITETPEVNVEREMLDDLIEEWKCKPAYTDVDAKFMNAPSEQQMVEKCPHGCALETHMPRNLNRHWNDVDGYLDYIRQTRFCREHGFARIYVTTGFLALGTDYNDRK